jgi:site-specific DNA-methyltransferase (adenine-specific)
MHPEQGTVARKRTMTTMDPYYQDDAVTIYHGKCEDILPALDRPDLILTDPPYALGDKWVGGGGEHSKTSWRFDPSEARAWDSDLAVAVPGLVDAARHVVIWGGNYYPLPPVRCWFLWDKKQNDQWTTGQAEMAWTNVDRPIRMFRMAQAEAHGEMHPKVHPTQKPLSLMSWCIAMIRDDTIRTVLDPFMGSGTTLRAACDRGIHAIGIEVDERYCEMAVARLAQGSLFTAGVVP